MVGLLFRDTFFSILCMSLLLQNQLFPFKYEDLSVLLMGMAITLIENKKILLASINGLRKWTLRIHIHSQARDGTGVIILIIQNL